MASNDQNSPDDDDSSSISSLQSLIYSIGRLKFSLRALSSVQFQASLLPHSETEPVSDCIYSSESNKILENVTNEVISKQFTDGKVPSSSDRKEIPHVASVEELEMVYKNLHDEYEKIRLHYLNALAQACEK